MKKFLYKFLVVMLALGMLTPSWITKMWVPTMAEAADVSLINEGFLGAPTPPAGWTFNSIGKYDGAGDVGAAAPSLKFDHIGDSVTTPTFLNANSLSFWIKGKGTNGTSTLQIDYYNGSWISLATLNPIGTTEQTVNYALASSATQLRFTYSVDHGDLAFDDVKVIRNNVTPSVPILSAPVDNYYINSTNQTTTAFSWLASTDDDSLTYNFRVDGGLAITGLSTTHTPDLSALSNGAHTWQVQATDGIITSAWSATRNFNKDTIAPSIDSNTSSPNTTGDETTISTSVSDSGSGVAYVGISVNGGSYNLMNPLGGANFAFYYTLPYDSLNPVTYQIKVIDGAGNITISDPISVIQPVDNDKPVIASITNNIANIGESTTITVNATDNIGPVSAKICFDGGAWENMVGSLSPFTYAKAIPVSATPITYFVKVFDAAGNWVQSDEQTIVITDTRPIFSGQSVSNITSTTATINWTTDHPSTSRVVYDSVSHLIVGLAPNYGYAYSTAENSALVTNHSVTVVGLTPGVTYYFRTISHGSPEAVGAESNFKTSLAPVVTTSVAVVTQPATPRVSAPSAVTPAPTVTAPVEQGQIKGTETNENQESEKINWTPWIILFILIILAGAATGGYFYWFGRDDEEEIITKEVIEKNKKLEKKDVKVAAKKNKRW